MSYLLMQTDITLSQAIVGLIFAILGSSGLTALITYFLTRDKTHAETLSIQGRNQKQQFENFDFGNDTLNDAAKEISRLRKRELDLSSDLHRRDLTIKTLEFEKAEASGQVKLISAEKELILQKVDELKIQVDDEKRECFKKIHELTVNHQSQIDFLKEQNDDLTTRLLHLETAGK